MLSDEDLARVLADVESRISLGSSASLDRSPRKNWVENAGGLPPFVREVARAIERETGKSLANAIQIAISRIKVWAAKGNKKAIKAVAQWEALKAKNKAKKVAASATTDSESEAAVNPARPVTSEEVAAVIALASARKVRTPEGAKHYGKPVGSLLGGGKGGSGKGGVKGGSGSSGGGTGGASRPAAVARPNPKGTDTTGIPVGSDGLTAAQRFLRTGRTTPRQAGVSGRHMKAQNAERDLKTYDDDHLMRLLERDRAIPDAEIGKFTSDALQTILEAEHDAERDEVGGAVSPTLAKNLAKIKAEMARRKKEGAKAAAARDLRTVRASADSEGAAEVALAGTTRRVRTPEGQQLFGKPIGSMIVADPKKPSVSQPGRASTGGLTSAPKYATVEAQFAKPPRMVSASDVAVGDVIWDEGMGATRVTSISKKTSGAVEFRGDEITASGIGKRNRYAGAWMGNAAVFSHKKDEWLAAGEATGGLTTPKTATPSKGAGNGTASGLKAPAQPPARKWSAAEKEMIRKYGLRPDGTIRDGSRMDDL